MSDKILKEAFDKLKAIEEADWGDDPSAPGYSGNKNPKPQTVSPGSHLANSLEKLTKRTPKKKRVKESDDNLHDAAIDLLDDMLADEQYSEQGDVLRYAIKRLQEVGLGR